VKSAPPNIEDFPGDTPAYVEAYGQWKREQRDGTKPAEQAIDAQPADGVRPEEVAPAGDEADQAPAVDVAATEVEEDLTKSPVGLDLQGGLTAIELNEKLKASPELDKLVKADPELKGALFRNARLAEKAAPYEELFGADGLEGAKAAVQNASSWVEVDRRFLSATTPQGVNDVLNFWAEQATYVDAQGNKIPRLDANNRPVTHNGQPVYEMAPSFGIILQRVRDSQIDAMLAGATARNDLELVDAIKVVKARIAGAASPSVNDDEVPEHIKQREANLTAREQENARQDRARQTQERQQFETAVETDIDSSIDALVSPVLAKANLSPFLVKAANEEIGRAIAESLEGNRFFQARLAELYSMAPTAETQKRIKQLVVNQVQGVAGPVVKRVLSEASQGFIKNASDKRDKIASQEATTRATEPRSTAGPASTSVPQQSPAQLLAEAEKQFEQQHNYKPGASDMPAVLELYGVLKQRQKGAKAG
jgi:hypothetical protein